MSVKPTWSINTRHVDTETSDVLALNLRVSYLGRECDLHIALMQPLLGKTPENEAALAELRRLRDALNGILGEQ